MALTVEKITLWRIEAKNKPGILASVLEPLAQAGADLELVMGYQYQGNPGKAAIEVYPVTGKRSLAAAKRAGLRPTTIPTLLVRGENQPGLGHVIASAIADAGINMSFLVAQVVGGQYSAIFGFASDAQARSAAALIKKAVGKNSK